MSEQDDAKALVDQFAARNTVSAWAHIRRADVAAGLKVRIDDPDKIDQANTNLCGPADFVRDIAEDHPKDYAKAVIDLYEQGNATIGTFAIKPGSGLRAHALVTVAAGGINPADWVILASIRDTDNWFLDYQEENDGAAAITMPHSKVKWFKAAGYTEVIEETNILKIKDLPNALKASRLFAQGYHVALFINADMLNASTMNNASTSPDHWVALTTPMTISSVNVKHPGALVEDKASSVQFQVYSWGRRIAVPPSGRLTDYHFLANYYGFIACRR